MCMIEGGTLDDARHAMDSNLTRDASNAASRVLRHRESPPPITLPRIIQHIADHKVKQNKIKHHNVGSEASCAYRREKKNNN